MNYEQQPHRRRNLLTGEWVICSPHRAARPWQGQLEDTARSKRPQHDPACYLCAGNARSGGKRNPDYQDTFVFENDFRALLDDEGHDEGDEKHPLLCSKLIRGTCRVVCFSPRHDLTLAQMSEAEISKVVQTWIDQTSELGQKYCWVQVFENKGAAMGCSNPHPHGQIWAMDDVPTVPNLEDENQFDYYRRNGSVLLSDYLETELKVEERLVCLNDDWAVLVPYWAVWPFETILLPRFKASRLTDLSFARVDSLSNILRNLLRRYDGLFNVDFPYSMGWHGAPFDGTAGEHWQVHAHFYPPLLRSASVRKFMVGFEMLGESQRDITPELAAERLRGVELEAASGKDCI
ncbi:UDP-glucose--hexose-1-phosphate uridylyltransferase [Pelagicoccus sp. SDUM812003]|uniref:UDP-glucose--hexose-1-phosphate uridylyltransferase n=1 Tax=Pelagicoccus sp. SDUM812003 TaxID=3041267 RepID=UPI00280E4CF8|nr:UDP-glucose--hexose-1-phosphate uridylyltransferase [Pelagicoccus sp. SDUM812003]MDQ8201474.1 UDP-glucose--hexose-1-phosphate uridylyltransferase [Pelagicoccus sp. SDUM812003]